MAEELKAALTDEDKSQPENLSGTAPLDVSGEWLSRQSR